MRADCKADQEEEYRAATMDICMCMYKKQETTSHKQRAQSKTAKSNGSWRESSRM